MKEEVVYPCRKQGSKDFVYRSSTQEGKDLLLARLGRLHARSMREVFFAVSDLPLFPEEEEEEEDEEAEAEEEEGREEGAGDAGKRQR